MPFTKAKDTYTTSFTVYQREAMITRWVTDEKPFGKLPTDFPPPIIVAGVGGSGTRLIVNILRSAGVDMGSRVNRSTQDALCFMPVLDKYQGDQYPPDHYAKILLDPCHSTVDPKNFARDMGAAMCLHRNGPGTDDEHFSALAASSASGAWGFKNPRFFWFLPLLDRTLPAFTFIHVVRHGVEHVASGMSKLQTARANNTPTVGACFSEAYDCWGPKLLDPKDTAALPRDVCEAILWDKLNSAVADYGELHMKNGRYFRVRYEDCCSNPADALMPVLRSLGLGPPDAEKLPKTYKPRFDPENFGPEKVERMTARVGNTLARFGYS